MAWLSCAPSSSEASLRYPIMKMALASLDTALAARHSAHPSPPPAEDVKVVTPISPVDSKSALQILEHVTDGLPISKSPSSLPLSPPSDHHPASPAPSDEDPARASSAEVSTSPALQLEDDFMVPSVTPAPQQQPAEPAPQVLPAADAKLCRQLLTALIKHTAAWPFQAPVRPVEDGAPNYLDVIKKPMDLSTVNKKLTDEEYIEVQDFANDIQLMLNNCFTYNPPTHQVHQLGRQLENFFSLQLNKLFPAITTTSLPVNQMAVAGAPVAPSRRHSKRAVKAPKVFEPEDIPIKKPKTGGSSRRSSNVYDDVMDDSSDDEEMMSQQISSLATCLETIHQQLALLTDNKKKNKRKRSVVAPAVVPAATSAPVPKRRKSSKAQAQVSHSSTTSPAPMDVDEPMAAVAIAAGPEKTCEYCGTRETPMWRRGPNGCGTLCNKCGVKWRNGKIMGDGKVPVIPVHSAATPYRPKPKAKKEGTSKAAKPRAPKGRKKSVSSISYEQKKELSVLINTLGEVETAGVVEIIRSGLPHLRDTQEEIELDIDSIDDGTLSRLYDFVKKASLAKAQPVVPAGPRGLSTPSDDEESADEGAEVESSSDSD